MAARDSSPSKDMQAKINTQQGQPEEHDSPPPLERQNAFIAPPRPRSASDGVTDPDVRREYFRGVGPISEANLTMAFESQQRTTRGDPLPPITPEAAGMQLGAPKTSSLMEYAIAQMRPKCKRKSRRLKISRKWPSGQNTWLEPPRRANSGANPPRTSLSKKKRKVAKRTRFKIKP